MAMFAKKQPVLTATFCNGMEDLRQAVEVLTGQYVRFVCVDFNTGRGQVRIGSTEFDLSFYSTEKDALSFEYHHLDGRNTARFDRESGEVRVINDSAQKSHKRAGHSMWWVGRSATERREEPLFPRDVEYCAKTRGLTVEEYLNELP